MSSITTARVRAWRTECLARTGEPTVVKAYQILRAILNTAVDDELILRNPCRIKGADRYDVPERPVQGGRLRRSNFRDETTRVWRGRVSPAGFEPATPALGVRSECGPAGAVDWWDSRTETLAYVPVRRR